MREKKAFVLQRGVEEPIAMGKLSVMWLTSMVEELKRGENLREIYRSFSSGHLVYIAHIRANSHERFLELSKYGVGGWLSFIVLLEGREGRGLGDYIA